MTIDDFIAFWAGSEGGAERANYVRFLDGLVAALGLPEVPLAARGSVTPDYGYEARVTEATPMGVVRRGRVDLYKRGCFILEAKQSHLPPGAVAVADYDPVEPAAPPPPPVLDLFGQPIAVPAAAPAPRSKKRAYDRLMADAFAQARGYAGALPADHGWPPFLIVCDVGRAFELFFDWTGNGKGYGFFPDRSSYRIELAELRKPEIQALLRGIWTDPPSVDPRRRSAEVTREIARRLARVSQALEQDERGRLVGRTDWEKSLGIEGTALFLMRVLFCMFAEEDGIELLPKDSFRNFLAEAIEKSDQWWTSGLTDLWSRMNDPQPANRYWPHGDAVVRYFNGNLFGNARIFTLPKEHKGELLAAAKCDWKAVEPAIFGTLLEQAITPSERAKLGAHYTPRPYVERLVEATIMDVLRPEWDAVRRGAVGEDEAPAPMLADVEAFHDRLACLRVLDPACGTGNFLYVAMENLLRLEADVLELIGQLGGTAAPRIGPNQFLGLEKNPRAAVIAELVLWIGWLRYRLANHPDAIGDPVLPPLDCINGGRHGGYDALLAADPDTGEIDLESPVAAAWPEADFIVGNPPFIGAKYLREKLTDAYTEAMWHAHPNVPKSADLVMQWWDRAAAMLTAPNARLRRFGLVTTNSITQTFSRRVIAARLSSERPLSLALAIPDHPWTRATRDAAAVRIAMTVAEAGKRDGELIEIAAERALDTDKPELEERRIHGRVNADLTVGTDATAVIALRANDGLCSPGVKLHGAGFIVTPAQATALGLGTRPGLEEHIRPYRHGRDLLQRSRGAMVIDLFGLTEKEVRERFPEVYQHVLKHVRDSIDPTTKLPNGRAVNARASYRDNWWLFGEPRSEMRPAIADLPRYISTPVTSRHRLFVFVDGAILPDDALMTIASDQSFLLGVLSSRPHLHWTYERCALIGVADFDKGHRYIKSLIFDPFPFPDATPAQRIVIGDLAEELDLTRRVALDENPGLTMTGLYNMVAKLRSGTAVTGAEEAAAVKARARIVAKLHDDIDAAVATAYGWPSDLAPAEIVARLVALNAERAAEERAGHVRWLRPDYQAAGAVAPAA